MRLNVALNMTWNVASSNLAKTLVSSTLGLLVWGALLQSSSLATAVEVGAPLLTDSIDEAAAPVISTSGQMTELTEPDGTTVILPPSYQHGQQYPALVLMPYTDRTALHMFNWGIYDAYHRSSDSDFIVIMPPGQ
ncbi:MAG: hypothetical protein AAFO84_11385, partial [Cyanobacteria bacterium J06598_1]